MLKKIIAAVAMVAAFFVAIGFIGSYEAETISATQCILAVGLCSIVEYAALKNI